MNTDDKKIVPFPGTKEKEQKNHAEETDLCETSEKQLFPKWLKSAIISVVVPVIAGVALHYITNRMGDISLAESYTLPQAYSREEYIAVASDEDKEAEAAAEEENTRIPCYEKAFTLRSFFESDMTGTAQMTGSVLKVDSLERYEYSEVDHFAFVKGREVRYYVVNGGNGAAPGEKLTLSADLVPGEEFRDAKQISWAEIDERGGEDKDGKLSIDTEEIPGGDGVRAYAFTLTDSAVNRLAQNDKIMLNLEGIFNGREGELMLGFLCMREGEIILDTGGAGDSDEKNKYYAYVDVSAGSGQEIPVNAVVDIRDRAAVDTVIIPSESCWIECYMQYKVEGEEMNTESFAAVVKVPLYKFFGTHSIASHMNEEDMRHYVYRTNKELHQQVAFDPRSLIDTGEDEY